ISMAETREAVVEEPPPHFAEPEPPDAEDSEFLPAPRVCSGRAVPDDGKFGGRVALTFDDGPYPEVTPRILATLRQHQVPAAFLLNGERLVTAKEQAIAQEIGADPDFLVGNHGFSHRSFSTLERPEARAEIVDTSTALQDLGIEPRYFRFPFGRATCEARALVEAEGLRVTGWHVASADWCFSERNGWCRPWRYRYVPSHLRRDMSAFVLRQVRRRRGGIVLLHDRPFTADHLEELIVRLRDDGFSFTRIDDRETFPKLNGTFDRAAPVRSEAATDETGADHVEA
ncbi:MAG: polysaccharide deacetylase family protein, partial [Myxococcota bacterium]